MTDDHKLYRLTNCVKAWCARYPGHSPETVTYDPERQSYTIAIVMRDTIELTKAIEDTLDDSEQFNLTLDMWFGKDMGGGKDGNR